MKETRVMLRLLPALLILASPAAAHGTGLPHLHGVEAATWLVLGTAFAVAVLAVRAKVLAGKRGRK